MIEKTNQDLTKDFFDVVLDVISRSSSKSYGLLVLKNLKRTLSKDFPFLRFIKINATVKIDNMVNSIDEKRIGKLFSRIINMLGPDLSKLLVKGELDQEGIKYLNKIGARF